MVEVVKSKIKCGCCKRILAYDLEDNEQVKYITCTVCKYDNHIL